MHSYTRYDDLKPAAKGAVIALGNFDGIHRGHQAVIAAAKSIADEQGAPLGIGLFRPHPRSYFAPNSEPFRLMSARQRAMTLPEYGVDRLYEIPFNDALRSMDDIEFVDQVLSKGLGVKHVVVGNDFKFGSGRCGDIESLTRLCAERGIGVSGLEPIGLHKFYGKYGSTQIREALRKGDVFHAAHMLSRPWCVDGIVTKGAQRGRTIGFPTANIAFGDLVRPLYGVYAVQVRIDGDDRWRAGVANTGTRPTVDGEEARVEANIFDFDGDIYGKMIDVRFRSFIRAERKFDSFEALKDQIAKDALGARAVLGA